MKPPVYFAERAWIGGAWQQNVLMTVDARGHWQSIEQGQVMPLGAVRLSGPVLPSLVNAHSHAFQRAFAGLAERRDSDKDDFWSWRDRMYGVALRVGPSQLRAIAAQLYAELLCGGYTQTCEFHYLHHRPDGQPYADPLTLSWALADAAQEAGMGLTVLPVLYERAGFAQPSLRDDQRRFATTAESVWQACERINAQRRPGLNAGVAVHSLRAAHESSIHKLKRLVGDSAVPVHIHIAEQMAEVRDCEATHGQRPMQWLCAQGLPDARWQLVHATHSTPAEIEAVAASGAGVVICPGTEGNLGDGLCDLPGWLRAAVPFSLGSDSHVTRRWGEELRWLEYGQRLYLQQRNVAAAPGRTPATAARLFDAALAGSAAPAGFAQWGLQVGARADFLVLDAQHSGLLGVPESHLLDALVFATQGEAIATVFVAGCAVVRQGRHLREASIKAAFAEAMGELWA